MRARGLLLGFWCCVACVWSRLVPLHKQFDAYSK
jgi:hypothetical protein